jgi:hypothetical protein
MLTSHSRQIIGEMTTVIFARLAEAALEQDQTWEQQQAQQYEAGVLHSNGDAPKQQQQQQQQQLACRQVLQDRPPLGCKFGHGVASAREVFIFLMDLIMQRQVGRAG